ncbi:MAG: outer membrane lipoprotein-sorting protein [Spirochaetia bacterium]|nr:outer membrane lipoprotein-sorting protein [Spirochaetia bacterium]
MKKIIIAILLCCCVICSAYAETDYVKMLKDVDALVTFKESDLSAEYTIVKRDPDGSSSTTVAAMFRRDSEEKFVVLVLQPTADKGKGYLKQGNNLWLYDPIGKGFTFTSAKERFQDSSFRVSDFTGSNYSGNYKINSVKQEKLGKFNCTVFDLEAITKSVSFPKVKIWVSEDNLVRKLEDYSLSGQLMRTSAFPSYQKVGKRWVPAKIIIQDHLVFRKVGDKIEYERTTVDIKNPSLKKQPDSLYTKEYLERVNTK